MKRVLLSATAIVMIASAALSVNAQTFNIDHSVEFVDANGDVVDNGSVINRMDVEENDYGKLQISSGLYAKNTTEDVVGVAVQLTIETLPSGSFQHCFPGSCKVTQSPQTDYSYTQGPMSSRAGTTESLQSEWLVEEGKYGTCTVTYQFKIYEIDPISFEYNFYADGPSVTVNYIYADPAGINANVADQVLKDVGYYDLSGRRVSNPSSGVYVKKMVYADGSVVTKKMTLK